MIHITSPPLPPQMDLAKLYINENGCITDHYGQIIGMCASTKCLAGAAIYDSDHVCHVAASTLGSAAPPRFEDNPEAKMEPVSPSASLDIFADEEEEQKVDVHIHIHPERSSASRSDTVATDSTPDKKKKKKSQKPRKVDRTRDALYKRINKKLSADRHRGKSKFTGSLHRVSQKG